VRLGQPTGQSPTLRVSRAVSSRAALPRPRWRQGMSPHRASCRRDRPGSTAASFAREPLPTLEPEPPPPPPPTPPPFGEELSFSCLSLKFSSGSPPRAVGAHRHRRRPSELHRRTGPFSPPHRCRVVWVSPQP
jgi:hypothetical protein